MHSNLYDKEKGQDCKPVGLPPLRSLLTTLDSRNPGVTPVTTLNFNNRKSFTNSTILPIPQASTLSNPINITGNQNNNGIIINNNNLLTFNHPTTTDSVPVAPLTTSMTSVGNSQQQLPFNMSSRTHEFELYRSTAGASSPNNMYDPFPKYHKPEILLKDQYDHNNNKNNMNCAVSKAISTPTINSNPKVTKKKLKNHTSYMTKFPIINHMTHNNNINNDTSTITINNEKNYETSTTPSPKQPSPENKPVNVSSDVVEELTSLQHGRRSNLPKETIRILNSWLLNHLQNPYPTSQEKRDLLIKTGLTKVQLSNWFINVRRRKIFHDYYEMAQNMKSSQDDSETETNNTNNFINQMRPATSNDETAEYDDLDRRFAHTPVTRRKN
ncbi:Cup9p NDAI_0F02170 [Naumovozyma dairenensis CBS 421]|uniref:Homeobox domain-containing protein n=1 Tax=Naumovozyma dairenensis (strain ATCC 10597 / BCRC 20456 / CBS 421 / NBRC 0211 / NRRL Y-12639) TaxID=1071378 RepID=G0WCM4_NAUDC|nr:hypothetical protein NDAI_0F02170 [Naumovozyma dairenensis CBS 421]CCD25535.1 hypothetical protein NDAI_0F02170 [Naumovozyma dairenensis CBS 421]